MLRKFLDVFSAFEWDSMALSLQGPIPLSAFDDPEGMLLPFRRGTFLILLLVKCPLAPVLLTG